MLSLALYATDITGGANGLNGIPRLIDTPGLLLWIAARGVCARLAWRARASAMHSMRFGRTKRSRSRWASRRSRHQALAFALSGAIAGLTGGAHGVSQPQRGAGGVRLRHAGHCARVCGAGRPALGAGPARRRDHPHLLPELARPLADNRLIVHGAVLMLVITYLPHGIVDTLQIAVAGESPPRRARAR